MTAPELPFEKRPDHVIWEYEFSRLVSAVYGRPYSHQQLFFDGQNTYFEFDVLDPAQMAPGRDEVAAAELAVWIAKWDERDAGNLQAELVAMREDFIDTEVIAQDLHSRGLMPVGTYLMKTWW